MEYNVELSIQMRKSSPYNTLESLVREIAQIFEKYGGTFSAYENAERGIDPSKGQWASFKNQKLQGNKARIRLDFVTLVEKYPSTTIDVNLVATSFPGQIGNSRF